MDQIFKKAFKEILRFEGGYTNDKDDRGGKTKYGVTEEVARAVGYQGKIKDLTIDDAKNIYYQYYWTKYNYDRLENKKIAIECFDQAVNLGPKTANKHLQRASNLLSQQEIAVDGLIGPITLSAVNNSSYQDELLKLLNIMQGTRYIEIAERDGEQKKFIKGWLKRVHL